MTQTKRVIEFIRTHPDCTTMELTLALSPFVSNPRARISDARAQGIEIVCERRSDGRLGYRIADPRPAVLRGEQEVLAL